MMAHDGSWFRVSPGVSPGSLSFFHALSIPEFGDQTSSVVSCGFLIFNWLWISNCREGEIRLDFTSNRHRTLIRYQDDQGRPWHFLNSLAYFELICAQITSDLNDLMSSNGFMKDYEGFLAPRLSTIHNEGRLLRSHTAIFTSEFHRLS
jgi:hypothetical protein